MSDRMMRASRLPFSNRISVVLSVLCLQALTANAQDSLETRTVQYLSGGDTVSAYLAMPAGEGPFPALLLIHEWWGLNEWIKHNADEFARQGYVAMAIDLYRGRVAASSDEAHELMRGLPEGR
ncbi:MAG TPA: dienelactone hydrolase family protein, partial [Bacteroidota bacterium]|nr:dienelactone hydrolase family protein [Bacteroidota bacterium]